MQHNLHNHIHSTISVTDDVAGFVGGAAFSLIGYINAGNFSTFIAYSVIGGIVGVVVKRSVDALIDWGKQEFINYRNRKQNEHKN